VGVGFNAKSDTIVQPSQIVPNVRKSSAISIKSPTFVDFDKSDEEAIELLAENGFKVWKLRKGIFKKRCFVYKWDSNVGKVTVKLINKTKVRVDFQSFNSDILMNGVEGDLLSYKWFYEPNGRIRYSEVRSRKYSAIIDLDAKKMVVYRNEGKTLKELKDEVFYFTNCN
jgi:hypothetical protein